MGVIRYLLDTNVCINLLRNNSPNVVARFAFAGPEACCISEITLAELRVGAEISMRPAYQHMLIDKLENSLPALPITDVIRIFAKESARLQASGQVIDNFDLFIGATAKEHGLIMVTNNTKHFSRMSLLQLEDLTQAPASS